MRTVAVRITAQPLAVDVTVDGDRVEKGSTISLKPGRHVAVLHHPACQGCEDSTHPFKVEPSATPLHEHFTFRYPPTELQVLCSGGQVSVAGKPVGSCGKVLRVPVTSHLPETREVRVTLDAGDTRSRPFIFKPRGQIRWTVE